MAEYLPIRTPGEALVMSASATITAGTLVAVSGSGTVAVAGAAAINWLGVAAFDAVSGDVLTVHSGGVQELTASGAITAGDGIVAAAAGLVSTAGAAPDSRTLVGVALSTAANATKVRVKFTR